MLRESWYVACATSRLASNPLPVRVLDQDLVVYRDNDGSPHALLDRCCHRGVKLSLGRVADGNLACGYHGWRYNGTGRCVLVPSLPADFRIPKALGVPAFTCKEQDSYIWVWMGQGDAQPTEPPRIAEFDQYQWRQGVSSMACSATMLIENQFDCAHPAFAHEGTHPSYFASKVGGMREYSFEVRTTADGIVAFYPPTDSADEPIPEDYTSLTRLELPSRVCIHQRMWRVDFFVLVHIVPTGASTCRMEWLQRGKKGDTGVTWVDRETRLIEQDRLLLESAQPAYDGGEKFERSVAADVVTVMVRRVMTLAGKGRWMQDRHVIPRRHIVHLRG